MSIETTATRTTPLKWPTLLVLLANFFCAGVAPASAGGQIHASWRRIAASDSGLSRPSSRIASQRRMPSSAGVGPNQSEDAIQVRIS